MAPTRREDLQASQRLILDWVLEVVGSMPEDREIYGRAAGGPKSYR
jgi:hypothetical protein